MKINNKVLMLFTNLVALAIISSLTSCGASKKKQNNAPENYQSVMDDIGKLIRIAFNGDSMNKVKMIEAKNSKGVVVERESFAYDGDDQIKTTKETYDENGTLDYRRISEDGKGDCANKLSVSEYFGSWKSKNIYKTTKKCDGNREIEVEEVSIAVDENGKEKIRSTSHEYYDNEGDLIKKVDTDQDGKKSTTEYKRVRDAQKRVIEKLEIVDGKNTSKEVNDHNKGIEIEYATATNSSEFTIEKSYKKDLPTGQVPMINWFGLDGLGYFEEARTLSTDEKANGSCNGTASQMVCSSKRYDISTTKEIESFDATATALLVKVQEPEKFRTLPSLSKFVVGDSVLLMYRPTRTVKVGMNYKGVKSTTTTESTYNAQQMLTKEVTTEVSEDGKTSTSTEEITYGDDGYKILTKMKTVDGVTTTYTYSY